MERNKEIWPRDWEGGEGMQQNPFVAVVFPHCHSCPDPSLALLDRHQIQRTDRRSNPNT